MGGREHPDFARPLANGEGGPLWASYAPDGYICPFCGLAAGEVSAPGNRCELSDLVHQDQDLLVFMACDGFGPYEGHAMIIPSAHYEALYDLPDELLAKVGTMQRDVALAMKLAWGPEGTSVRQHNEPAGNQHVWHYHLHVFPRYRDDMLYRQIRHPVDVHVRSRKAQELRTALRTVRSAKTG